MQLFREVLLRSIKIINIGWATVSYFILAVLTIFLLDKIYGKYNPKYYEKLSTFEINKEAIIYLWILGIFVYLVRNIFPLIPFPFDGLYGYDHNKVKEVTTAAIYAAFIVLFNERIQGYYTLIKQRLFNF